jgi:hypothetical protein
MAAVIGLSLGITAQNNAISDYYQDHKEGEDVTTVSITGKLFSMMSDVEVDEPEAKEMLDFMSSITAIDIVMTDPAKFSENRYNDSRKRLPARYEELMEVEDKDGRFDFRIDEADGKVNEVFMIGAMEDRLILVSITGDLDIRQIGRIAKEIQMEGFEKMEKVETYEMDEVKVYPNPVKQRSNFWVEVPEDMIGGEAVLYDLNGKQALVYPIGARKQQVETGRLGAGTYVLEMKHDGSILSNRLEVVR